MYQILIVDDHALTRMGVVQFIQHVLGGAKVTEAETAQAALNLVRKQSFDLMFLDIDLPDRSGLDILADVKLLRPKMPVVFLSGMVDYAFASQAMRGGASGYVEKGCPPEELRKALTQVLGGGRYISGPMAEQLALQVTQPGQARPEETLSSREFQVLRQLGAGKTITEIGANLCLSVKTVSTYRSRLLEKLNLKSTNELVRYAVKQKLVE